ncbi:MAG: TVP38/TMEM64 family protein [Tabrizicola sp.]
MRDLPGIGLILALVFASTFVLARWSGILPEEDLLAWLQDLRERHPAWLIGAVLLLLVPDLFIAVPTMTTVLLAGWLLGAGPGGRTAASGLLLMGSTACLIGRSAGRRGLSRLFRADARLAGIERALARNDLLTLAICQALPILPELSATLAGIARTPPLRFLAGWALGVVPFSFVVAGGGAASSPDDLRPAILTAIGTTAVLLLAWRILPRRSG